MTELMNYVRNLAGCGHKVEKHQHHPTPQVKWREIVSSGRLVCIIILYVILSFSGVTFVLVLFGFVLVFMRFLPRIITAVLRSTVVLR